jgi:coproporphyrinogen III oxidase-like Fe-S oxidoreductase
MYWRGAYFVALGPGAAGFVPTDTGIGVRYTNPPIKGWLEDKPPEALAVTPQIFTEDMLMTGLRTKVGVNLEHVRTRSGIDVLEHYAPLLDNFFTQNLLTYDTPYLRTTNLGLLQLNGILAAFFNTDSMLLES